MAKRYFKIEGIIELNDNFFSEQSKKDLTNSLSEDFLNDFCYELNANFGGGIKEVDENGEDLN